MAQLILGIGTSHAPSLSTPLVEWNLHAERDRTAQTLWFRGSIHTFDDLVAERACDAIVEQVNDATWLTCHEGCERGVAAVGKALKEAKPDVVIIVGDDQRELFLDECLPALAIYHGETISVTPVEPEQLPVATRSARWAMYGERNAKYPVASDLATHLIDHTVRAGFDVAQSRRVLDGRTLGHAYNFLYQRMMDDTWIEPPAIVPIFVNATQPPNQLPPTRITAFGHALRQAIDAWPGPERIILMASGGLSHFVVDEKMDRSILDALATGDIAALSAIPNEYLNAGSGEIRNWLTVGSALRDLRFELLDYIPLYRTAAGTGIGMAYALWHA